MNCMQRIGGGKPMSESEMQAELERLRAENAELKSKVKGGLTLKVSEKGGVSLYGMGRFPVALYKEQWLRILASAPESRTGQICAASVDRSLAGCHAKVHWTKVVL